MLATLRILAEIAGAGAAIAAGLWAIPNSPLRRAFETWIERRVALRFEKELENHRHQLALEAERVKSEYQRSLHNLSIVAERRHEVCRELYRLIFIADGAVCGLFGVREASTFEDYTVADLTKYVDSVEFAGRTKEYILANWDNDRQSAIAELRGAERRVEVARATDAHREAWNYFLTNSLYLDDAVTALARRVFDTLREVLIVAKFPEARGAGRLTDLQTLSSELIWQLRRQLQIALGVTPDSAPVPADPAA